MRLGGEYKPPRNKPCPCGSGRKFKHCCAATYKADRPFLAAFTAFNEGRYEEALQTCRADITRYAIWHKSHTVPILDKPGQGDMGEALLYTDIRALSDLVQLLLRCYQSTYRLHEFPAVLGRLKRTVEDPRWEQRLVYYHALAVLADEFDEGAARQVLKQLEPFDNVDDPEILQLHIDLSGADLGFSERNRIIDRIISLAEEPVDRLHYRSLRGVELFLIGDSEGCAAEIEYAIRDFREQRKESLTSYESYQLGHSLDFLGVVTGDTKLFDEARGLFEAALLDEALNRRGRAQLHTCVAETWVHAEDWDRAKDAFHRSLDYEDTAVARVLLADCFVNLSDITRALEYLDSVELESVDPATKADAAFTYAAAAIAAPDTDRVSAASEILRTIHVPIPYIRERRHRLLLALEPLKSREASNEEVANARRTLRDLIGIAGRYVLLRPNFMGLGLDINRLIEDFCGATRRGSDEAPS